MKIIVTYFTDKELYYFELPYGEWVVNNKKYTVNNYQAEKINSLLEPEIFKVNKITNIKYYENVTGHAVAVVNGKLIDTFDNPAGKRVIAVFKKLENFAE